MPFDFKTPYGDSPQWGDSGSGRGSGAAMPFFRSPSPSSMRLEQEVAWNPAQAYVDLQMACQILSERGLKLASKWAAELWMGLPHVDAAATANLQPNNIPASLMPRGATMPPMLAYAKTLLDLGEFAHAAAILSETHPTVERMPPPQPDLEPAAVSLRAYALYMAGERCKEEAHQESNR